MTKHIYSYSLETETAKMIRIEKATRGNRSVDELFRELLTLKKKDRSESLLSL